MTRKTIAFIACCLISPAIAAAQTGGLTKVQLLALQQQLKDECGLQHATGVMDGPTRHAIAVCNKKYGTQGNGAALLSAMNIGFNSGDNAPEGGMGTVMGNDADDHMNMNVDSSYTDSAGVVHHHTVHSNRSRGSRATGAARSSAGRGRARSHGGNANATGMNRGMIDRDAPMHGVDSTSGGLDVDGRTNDRRMAHDSAMAGRRDGRVRNPGVGKGGVKYGKDSVKH